MKTTNTVTVFRLLDKKTEIDRNTLIALCDVTRVGGAPGGFAKLGGGTDGTSVEFGGNGYLRDTLSILMHIRDTTRMQMTKTLMPQNTELVASEVTDDILMLIDRAKE